MKTTAVVRPDIAAKYAELFGSQSVNGRSINVEDTIARLTEDTLDAFHEILKERHALQARVIRDETRYGFVDGSVVVSDPDGHSATVAAIRQGMLDRFFGRQTATAWRVPANIPADVMTPGLEGTGPCIDLGMAMGALNSGASQWMWDWEDAGGDYREQLYQAWTNMKHILAHDWVGKPFVHPTKTVKDASGKQVPRQYTIKVPPAEWPTILHRVGGLHLVNRQITLEGREVPAIIPGLVIHALNNYESQKKNGSGIYYYVPKLETWQEAKLVGTLLKALEGVMGLARGSLKVKLLNERGEFVLQQELIQWVLRENLIGPNVGRWDYLFSREDMFRHDPAMVIPDPHTLTMTEATLSHYTRRNALVATLAGAMPIGGMAAQMQNPRAPENDPKALRDIWFDKLRERLTGLFLIDGKLYDTYRQSWVATVQPEYVAAGREPLVTEYAQLQSVVAKATDAERARLEGLGLLKDGRMAPMALTEKDVTVDKLFSEEERLRIFSRPKGPTTEDGLRYAMYMATEFMYQQLQGNNAAAIDDPKTGLRFMNDLATYEIFWHFLYLTVFHGVTLTDDGKYSKKGDRVTPQLFDRLLEERRQTVKELFAKLGVVYEKTHAELVLQVLRKQVIDTAPDGTLVPQKRWLKYGSRVLISLVEQTPAARDAILDAVFTDRPELVARVKRAAGDAAALDVARRALKAHDYVYDVFEAPQAVAV
jgi:malate synthase